MMESWDMLRWSTIVGCLILVATNLAVGEFYTNLMDIALAGEEYPDI
jgi:hypothetical protein